MPTYEYRCDECGCTFERFQGIRDEPLRTCPECSGIVHRLIGRGAGIISKGSGVHGPDYANNRSPSCGRSSPCCGREIPCNEKPCES